MEPTEEENNPAEGVPAAAARYSQSATEPLRPTVRCACGRHRAPGGIIGCRRSTRHRRASSRTAAPLVALSHRRCSSDDDDDDDAVAAVVCILDGKKTGASRTFGGRGGGS